jgi:hypothetical protein
MRKVSKVAFGLFCAVLFISADVHDQATVSGQVRTLTGVPIKGATVKLVTLNLTRTTDDSGKYDFGATVGIERSAGLSQSPDYSLVAKGRKIALTVVRTETFSIAMYDVTGRMVRKCLEGLLVPGSHVVDIGHADNAVQMYVIRIKAGLFAECFTFAPATGLNVVRSAMKTAEGLEKAGEISAADSIVVSHPNYWGGLDGINARKISATTGMQNFRMYSNDTSATGWFASKMNFIFTPDTVGVTYYKQKVPDYEYEERQTQREIQQCFYRLPSEVPAGKKYTTYNVNINATVTTGVAATGGNTLSLNPGYCNNKPWWEILGVQHHEMCHSYQQYYNTTGASGFGEGIVDAVRCLSGFFYWPAGSKCSGGFDQPYQTGGRYWYYIELKHPGFIYRVMSSANTGDIAARVLSITGDSLSTLCRECESSGMPYTLGRGSF